MSKIINQLATIELSDEVLQGLDIGSIYQNFNKNYRNLDSLKNFKSEYEKKNAVMRWWHNDKLQNAQLESAEVQAEFSKTIGQLMMLSILQSKKLSEQQTQLNEQQRKLKSQADGIAEHAGELQNQHQVLAEQSEKLETLVHEYFELKGLTEDGAQRLINIAQEVKATKDGMLQEFTIRTKNIEVLCDEVATQMASVSSQATEQFRLSSEQTQSSIQALQKETQHELNAFSTKLAEQDVAYQEKLRLLDGGLNAQTTRVTEIDNALSAQKTDQKETRHELGAFSTKLAEQDAVYQEKLRLFDGGLNAQTMRVTEINNALSAQKTELTVCAQQQKTDQVQQVLFEKKITDRLNRLGLIVVCSSVITPIMLFGIARLMKWI